MSADHIPWTPARVRVTAGLMVAIFVAAMDSTIVATALPSIAGELHGFALYPWVFSAYLLTSTTTVPLWGRLADIFGRKRVLFTGLAIFIVGSLLCGVSGEMVHLVAFRGLQGIGAGCLLPVALTIVGDYFPLRQRARMQGMFSSVWAVASVVGPLIGASFVSTIGWRWIFGVNLPIGIIAVTLLAAYHDRPERTGPVHIDYAGSLLLTAGVALLLWGLGSGNAGGATLWPVVGAAMGVLVGFGLVERAAVSPTVPIDLLRHEVIGPAMVVATIGGTLMFCVISYVPLYVERVLGGSSYLAGYSVAPLLFGWATAATVSGRILLRAGLNRLAIAGSLFIVCGTALIFLAPPGLGVLPISAGSLVIGIGMGTVQTPLLIVVQGSVEWSQRGAATALNQFCRTIGGAVGVSLMGILLEAQLRAHAGAAGLDPTRVIALLSSPPGQGPRLVPAVRQVAGDGLHAVFAALVGLALASLVASAWMSLLARRRGGAVAAVPATAPAMRMME